ncbi:MAG: peptidoglycan editing factor PgeF [Rhodospirillaceae bacterium]|nr:peptidoglycan editing factor PgeF [Rhodospirillaceae bacterium]
MPAALEISALRLSGVRHGFFGRAGGRSHGIYTSNNFGFGSGDDRETVAANRAACAARLGLPGFVTVLQRHTPKVERVTAPWPAEAAPVADAMVTNVRGVGLGILTADCAPILFADAHAGVIGAAHAGWRGAFDGVIEATVAAMTALGAQRADIAAAVGPCIGQTSYEVGPEFVARFVERDRNFTRYFANPKPSGHRDFDLAGFVGDALRAANVGTVVLSGRDTCAEEDTYFSYRRTTLRKEPDYGRQISVIGLV